MTKEDNTPPILKGISKSLMSFYKSTLIFFFNYSIIKNVLVCAISIIWFNPTYVFFMSSTFLIKVSINLFIATKQLNLFWYHCCQKNIAHISCNWSKDFTYIYTSYDENMRRITRLIGLKNHFMQYIFRKKIMKTFLGLTQMLAQNFIKLNFS